MRAIVATACFPTVLAHVLEDGDLLAAIYSAGLLPRLLPDAALPLSVASSAPAPDSALVAAAAAPAAPAGGAAALEAALRADVDTAAAAAAAAPPFPEDARSDAERRAAMAADMALIHAVVTQFATNRQQVDVCLQVAAVAALLADQAAGAARAAPAVLAALRMPLPPPRDAPWDRLMRALRLPSLTQRALSQYEAACSNLYTKALPDALAQLAPPPLESNDKPDSGGDAAGVVEIGSGGATKRRGKRRGRNGGPGKLEVPAAPSLGGITVPKEAADEMLAHLERNHPGRVKVVGSGAIEIDQSVAEDVFKFLGGDPSDLDGRSGSGAGGAVGGGSSSGGESAEEALGALPKPLRKLLEKAARYAAGGGGDAVPMAGVPRPPTAGGGPIVNPLLLSAQQMAKMQQLASLFTGSSGEWLLRFWTERVRPARRGSAVRAQADSAAAAAAELPHAGVAAARAGAAAALADLAAALDDAGGGGAAMDHAERVRLGAAFAQGPAAVFAAAWGRSTAPLLEALAPEAAAAAFQRHVQAHVWPNNRLGPESHARLRFAGLLRDGGERAAAAAAGADSSAAGKSGGTAYGRGADAEVFGEFLEGFVEAAQSTATGPNRDRILSVSESARAAAADAAQAHGSGDAGGGRAMGRLAPLGRKLGTGKRAPATPDQVGADALSPVWRAEYAPCCCCRRVVTLFGSAGFGGVSDLAVVIRASMRSRAHSVRIHRAHTCDTVHIRNNVQSNRC